MDLEKRRFPVGRYQGPLSVSAELRANWLEELKGFPAIFQAMARSLNPDQLQTPYREGGWTALQVIHHVPDSHMNAYLRFRWAISEDNPMIKAYNEAEFAKMSDYQLTSIDGSLSFLESIHCRWVEVMEHMDDSDWKRTYRHPEDGKTYQLDKVLGMYVWHGNHHLGHLKIVKGLL